VLCRGEGAGDAGTTEHDARILVRKPPLFLLCNGLAERFLWAIAAEHIKQMQMTASQECLLGQSQELTQSTKGAYRQVQG
jgi:hypothetical protein